MNQRERHHAVTAEALLEHFGGSPNADTSTPLLDQVDQLLASSDRAIRRVLSANSEDFLRATRQHGGQ